MYKKPTFVDKLVVSMTNRVYCRAFGFQMNSIVLTKEKEKTTLNRIKFIQCRTRLHCEEEYLATKPQFVLQLVDKKIKICTFSDVSSVIICICLFFSMSLPHGVFDGPKIMATVMAPTYLHPVSLIQSKTVRSLILMIRFEQCFSLKNIQLILNKKYDEDFIYLR